ncbi:MAG: M3 family metallopeptidase [Balneolaceae bacterium]
MKKLLTFIILSVLTMACSNSENPFMKESALPYYAPDFNKIKNEHFEPAILEGIAQNKAQIEGIANNEEPATFENTLVALEKSGTLLNRTLAVFGALSSAHTNETIQNVQTKVAPLLAELSDAMYLNTKLFERIKYLHSNMESLALDAESKKLLQDYYEDFAIAGANLSDSDKEKLKEYNSRLASLTTEYSRVLLAANNAGAVTFTNKDDLAGISEDVLASLKNEEGGWTIPLQNTTQQPLLQVMENRDSRQKLFEAAWHRSDHGENDTRAIAKEIVKIRANKAKLLGYNNYAEWSLQKTMAKTPENVFEFFDALVPATTAKAKVEAQEIQEMIKSKGEDFTLEAWDWNRYAEMVRKAKYDLDEEQIKPYFEMTTVLEKGVFYAAEKLYGITFKERFDIPVYHEDVKVYELFEENGEPLGLFYGDFFARPSKRGGAWMSNFVQQSKLLDRKPVIYNVSNYSKPAKGNPALISFDDVTTTFHEFGHALHGFFADQNYPSLSGTSVARDFVEFPSQFFENWALYPEILKNYAVHYQTGEVIPQELIDKIKNSSTFNQGYSLTELLAASNLDMQWHTVSADMEIGDVNDFEKEALHKTKLDVVSAVPPRYRSTYFSHIFSSGYAAGYYSYQWTEMLDHDAYRWFEENGGLTRANGQRFRDMILSRGNTQDLEQMYINWRGHAPEVEPMLEARGLK